MAQTINTNVMSLNAQRNLNKTSESLATTVQRLSSGLRINSAKDDAAGLAISQRMTTQVNGMTVAIRNANDGISLAQTAEGALGSIGDNLQRIRELAVQAANGTNSSSDRNSLQKEVKQLQDEISRVVANTKFNDTLLLSGTSTISIQVGANATADDKIDIKLVDVSSIANTVSGLAVSGNDATNADLTIKGIDDALTTISNARADLGAVQNRFTSVISNLSVNSENLSASRGRITDADYAAETAELTRTQILQQAGTAMLAQANTLPNTVLKLLGQ